MKESQIIHRWYNFHFSSITSEARLSHRAHGSPALPPKGGAGWRKPRGSESHADPPATRQSLAEPGTPGGCNSAQAGAQGLVSNVVHLHPLSGESG